MKKIKTTILTIGALGVFAAPIGIIVASKSGDNSGGVSIVGQGSSSVKPIINSILKNTYYNTEYQVNGSGQGFQSQMSSPSLSAFGMTSSLKHPAKPEESEKWISNKNRTVTFAIDAIGIVLNLPDGISYASDVRPIINIEELAKIYDVDDADNLTTNTTWGELLDNKSEATTTSPSALAQTVIGFGRSGGKEASGTADGFWHTLKHHMGLLEPDLNHESLPKKNQTDEANAQAMNVLKENDGSVTYISLGYALNNENSNAIVATINPGASPNWEPTIENVKENKYGWMRPFNIIYSTNNTQAVTFANFLFTPEVQKLISDNNFVPLTTQQIKDQIPLDQTDKERNADLIAGTNMGIKI